MVVTADREPEPISRTGSSISVVKGETLATSNPGSLVDALRTVPGLDISESGGPGSTTNIRLRGANTGQTLVMIDGIRINDPTAASGDFDFAMFAPIAIERIEVLKGPQSALYGSDAMGGVVNIITKNGSGPAQFNVRTEGGSYGTAVTNGSMTGSTGAVVVCGHRRRPAQQRLLPLRLSDSAARSQIRPAGTRRLRPCRRLGPHRLRCR